MAGIGTWRPLCFIGFLGYINAEVNAKLNPTENEPILVFYGRHLRMLQVSSLFLAAFCGGIAYVTSWSDETLTRLSFPLIVGYAIGDEVLWLRLEKFARDQGIGIETRFRRVEMNVLVRRSR